MLKLRIWIWSTVLLFAGVLGAQEAKKPSAPGFDPQACAKHCQEMAAAHQKAMDAQKAMMEKRQAAWKDIEAQLDAAKKARGEKKVAALEAVLEKLVAFHNSMHEEMDRSPMMGGMMGCCGEGGMRMGMGAGMGMPMDCPMMKTMPTRPETAPEHAH